MCFKILLKTSVFGKYIWRKGAKNPCTFQLQTEFWILIHYNINTFYDFFLLCVQYFFEIHNYLSTAAVMTLTYRSNSILYSSQRKWNFMPIVSSQVPKCLYEMKHESIQFHTNIWYLFCWKIWSDDLAMLKNFAYIFFEFIAFWLSVLYFCVKGLHIIRYQSNLLKYLQCFKFSCSKITSKIHFKYVNILSILVCSIA